MRREQKLPPFLHSCCSSKTAPATAQSWAHQQCWWHLWGTVFKKVKNQCAAAVAERGERKMQEKTLQTPKSAKREERTCSRPMEKTMVRKAAPLQPMKDHGVTHSHCSLWRSHSRAGRAGMRRLELMESPGWSRVLAGALANEEEPTLEQVFWQELWPCLKDSTPWKRPLLEQFSKNWHPQRGFIFQEVWEGPYPTAGEGPYNGAGEQHDKEVVTEMKSCEVTAILIPQPPHEEELKYSGVKLHFTRKDEGRFIFYYSTLLLSVNKLSQVWFAQDSNFLLTHHLFVFSPPTLLNGEWAHSPHGYLESGKVHPPQHESQQGEKKKLKWKQDLGKDLCQLGKVIFTSVPTFSLGTLQTDKKLLLLYPLYWFK